MIKKIMYRTFLSLLFIICLTSPIWAQDLNVVDAGSAWPQEVVGAYTENGTNNGRPSYSGPNGYWLYHTQWSGLDCWLIGNIKGESEINSSGVRFFIINSSDTPPLNSSFSNTNSALGAVKVTTSAGSPPPAPGGIIAHSATASSFTVNWGDVSSATGYKLEVSNNSSFTNFVAGYNPYVITIPPGTPFASRPISHVINGLAPGDTYYFRMRAYNGFGDSPNSSTISSVSIPASPSAQGATNVNDTGFRANWAAQSGATSYLLYVSAASDFSSHIINNQYVSNNYYTISGLLPNTTYYYRVKAVNSSGQSGISETIQVTTGPSIPIAQGASSTQPYHFTANWQISTGSTGYYIDVATDESFNNMVSGYSNKDVGNATSFLVNGGLNPYTTYYYRIRAYNSIGTSSNSQTVSVTTLPVLPSVTTDSVILNTAVSLRMQGNIATLGVPAPTQYGFVWSTTGNPTITDNKTEKGVATETGVFTSEVSGLSPNTTYYIRAYATNSAGTVYGGQLEIKTEKKPLTIVAENKDKFFGEADPVFTADYIGFMDGDNELSLGGILEFVRTAGEDVGTYAITPSSLTSEKYEIIFTSGTLTINKKPLTITAENKSKTYGEVDPALTYLITSGELVGSDQITGALTREAGENVDSYAIEQGTLTAGSNYEITYVGGNLIIIKKGLTITAENKSKSYGEGDPVFTVSYDGFAPGEDKSNLSGILSVTREAGENVGIYEIIPFGLTSTNYEITFVNGVLSILSNNVDLSNLLLSRDTLKPAFDPSITSYAASVGNEVTGITITPTAEHATASITVNGAGVNSGEESGNMPLNVGNNVISVVVTAEAGNTKTYTITVTRAAPIDSSAPYITATDPVNNAVNVSVSKTIEITFSEDIFAGTNINLVSLKEGNTVVDYVYGIHGNQLTINPTLNLDYGTFYTLTIPKQTVVDAVYNTMEDEYILTFTTEIVLENNADLSGLAVSKGTLTPNFDRDITSYAVVVENSIQSIQVTPTVAGQNSDITVNGDTVESGQASQSISLSVGDNTTHILVTAEDGTEKRYTIVVKRKQKDDDNNDSGNGTDDKLEDVYVNGRPFEGATTQITEENGQTTMTVTVDDGKIQEILQGQGNNDIITIPVSGDFDRVVGVLNGETAKLMEDKNAVLEIKTGNVTYRLPANEIDIERLAQELGQNLGLKDIHLRVEISNVTDEILQTIEDTAEQNGYQILVKPVTFTITCSYGGRQVKISKFNQYVERIMAMPQGINPSKITTGIVLNNDVSFTHVPTTIVVIDGKVYAKISSLTNSTYSVIYNPISVAAVEEHWSKAPVNDMASRLVIKNPQSFEPNGEITRGEFAEYITKALGLYRTGAAEAGKFRDVGKSNELADAITIAVDNGIISGYPDDTFKPQAKLTREEAMTMYAKAMDIVGLKEKENNRITNYIDKDTVSGWAYDFVKKTISAGVFNGKTHETIDPKGTFTYAEAATAIRNLLIKAGMINQ